MIGIPMIMCRAWSPVIPKYREKKIWACRPSAPSRWNGVDHMPGSTWIRLTPTEPDSGPVRLDHVPAMWPRSPRQVRASSQ